MNAFVHFMASDPRGVNMSPMPITLKCVVLYVALLLVGTTPATCAADCSVPMATLTSLQGNVQFRNDPGSPWQPAQLQQALCGGTELRTDVLSRAQLRLHQSIAGSQRDGTLMQLNERSALILPQHQEAWWIQLLQGAAHILSRTPKNFTIQTQFSNAKIEGTEFLVQAGNTATQVQVYEGQVLVSNAHGSLRLSNGEGALIERKLAPQRVILVQPREAVQWALYYPPLIDVNLTARARAETEAQVMADYRQGRIATAIQRLEQQPQATQDSHYHALKAALYLSVGQVDLARQALADAKRLDSKNSEVLAQESIIALAQNDTRLALQLADQAVAMAPGSPIPFIAKSYAEQAHFRLEKASRAVREAVRLSPDNALAWARVAELELAQGNLAAAMQAADRARTLDPGLSRTLTMSGFSALASMDLNQAQAAFSDAIRLDSADPLPRLGLGLAKVRQGHLESGRKDIEDAANLDPGNALVRSYLGKAYYEEKRSTLAAKELDNAKTLDPQDPTPWFYDAIRKQTENRPIEALLDLQKSIDLNDNRAVYRSRLLLDQDHAERSAAVGRVYRDLSFEQRALVEGWKSTTAEPRDYASHRLLADSYSSLQRHEIARVSELLQAQLLQPVNNNPVQPRLAQSRLVLPPGAGPTGLAYNEFNPLFMSDRFALQTTGIVGNNDTFADEVTHSGFFGVGSYSVGQYHYQTTGFRPNNDLDQNVYNAQAQLLLGPRLSIQAEFRQQDVDQGDLELRFDPKNSFNDRYRFNQTLGRFGARLALTQNSDVLFSGLYQSAIEARRIQLPGIPDIVPGGAEVDTGTDSYQLEGQYLYSANNFNIRTGASAYKGDLRQRIGYTPTPIPPVFLNSLNKYEQQHTVGYLYADFKLVPSVIFTSAVSYDNFSERGFELADKISPKFGLQWQATKGLLLRAAYIDYVKRPLLADQTIEPTQIAGFNQFFDDFNASRVRRYGVAMDGQSNNSFYWGIEMSKRELLNVPILDSRVNAYASETNKEDLYRGYLYWAPHRSWSFSAEYQFDRYKVVSRLADDLRPARIDTMSIPLRVNYFHDSGFFAKAGITVVNQELNLDHSFLQVPKTEDTFSLVDLGLGFRLPKRLGIASLECRNLFDRSFYYHDDTYRSSTPLRTPRFVPDRTFLASITLSF